MASSTTGMLRLSSIPSSSTVKKLKEAAATPKTLVIECSSRPQKKATAHHMKTRPKKTQPWDIKRRGPTPYPPLPSLPPDWTLVSAASPEDFEERRLQKQMMEEEEEEGGAEAEQEVVAAA